MTKSLDATGLPKPPEGYFWSVRPNMMTGSPYLHLMKEVDVYFFKFNRSVYSQFIPFGTKGSMIRTADEILSTLDIYGDYK
jgi:hypothetical protein